MTSVSIDEGTNDSTLPAEFLILLKNSTHYQKKAMLLALKNSLNSDLSHNPLTTIDFNVYVDVVRDFVPQNFLEDALMAEVEHLGLCKTSNKPLTQWLSLDNRPYCFSDKSNLKHDSKIINEFPTICSLMNLVNNDSRTTQDANSVLVIVYNNNNASIDFHDDNESLIDGRSSISTITFGSSRTVDFCDHKLRPRIPQHSIDCNNHDMMVMKPGCQQSLVHRVRKGSGSNDIRIVFSFRKIVDPLNPTSSNADDPEISFDVASPISPSTDAASSSPEPPNTSVQNSHLSSQQRPKVTLLAGDSFLVGLDIDRLGRKGKKTVVNVSKGGASVEDVSRQIEAYFLSFTDEISSPFVEKVVVCVGTNDIRNCRENGVRHLKRPLVSLMEKIKLIFPDATVWFQSLIPLIVQNQFSVKNIEQFNSLLFEVCSYMKVYYLNIFGMFLKFDRERRGVFRNEFLFINSKNIHLNKIGLGLLARSYIRIIHSNTFNPLGF